MNDIFTKELNLPTTIRGYVMSLPDGNYCIVLNANLTFEQRVNTYEHELRHIKNGDYEKKSDIDLIEVNCHKED